jgi:uncharacterized protein DUF4382
MKSPATFFKALPWLMALLLVALIGACGGGGDSPGMAQGTLGVSLTDSACGFEEVNVTVRRVRVHRSSSASDTEGGWTDIALNPPRKINLVNLTNGVLESLGQTLLAAGHYTQLRLVLDPNSGAGLANSVVPMGGVAAGLATPSGVQSGIKLINEFDVPAGGQVDVVLDFDACKSVVARGDGTFALKPVIKVVPFVLNGINGFVDAALLAGNVMVTAQQNGEVVQATAPNTQTGEFLLARLAPGSYDVVFTADGRATAVISAVPVATTTSIVTVSTSAARITMPVSGARMISGTAILNPVNPDTVTFVAAKQTFGATPTVTVKSVAADDLASGAYALTLPTGAPLLGQYSATLPIALAAQSGVAGLYTVAASATGYQAQSLAKDISAADATQDFVLVP